ILGLLNLAHSAVYMWGAFLGLMVVDRLEVSPWWAIPAGMLGGGIIGVLVDWVAFLPLRRRNAPRTAQLISSIGAAIILVNLASIVFGTSPQYFPPESLSGITYFEKRPLQELTIAGNTLIEEIPFVLQPI